MFRTTSSSSEADPIVEDFIIFAACLEIPYPFYFSEIWETHSGDLVIEEFMSMLPPVICHRFD